MLHDYKRVINGLGCMTVKESGQGVRHYALASGGLGKGLGLGFRVRLGLIYRLYIHNLPDVSVYSIYGLFDAALL